MEAFYLCTRREIENRKYKVRIVNHKIKRKKKEYKIKNSKKINQELKPYLSKKEMIDKINRCIPMNNTDQLLLLEFLKKNSYFRFSIYVKLMKSIQNITIVDVIETYKIDKFIRNNLNYFTNQIEVFWKNSISDIMCTEYKETSDYTTVQCYLDQDIYSGLEWSQKMIRYFNTYFYENNSPSFKHHHYKKNHCLPIWVLFEEITFGSLTTFITQINSEYYNSWVMYCYNNTKYKNTMKSWINVIRAYRNKAAHHSRIYGFKVTDAPKIIKNDSNFYFPNKKEIDEQKLYLYGGLYVLKHLLVYEDNFTQTLWNEFLVTLDMKISEIPCLDKVKYGLPDNWKEKLKIITI